MELKRKVGPRDRRVDGEHVRSRPRARRLRLDGLAVDGEVQTYEGSEGHNWDGNGRTRRWRLSRTPICCAPAGELEMRWRCQAETRIDAAAWSRELQTCLLFAALGIIAEVRHAFGDETLPAGLYVVTRTRDQ
jgi:hypothetical protein